MGDLEGGPQPSGLLPDQAAAYADSFAKSRSIDNARWKKAEQCTTELIKRIRGTHSSEIRRKEVADYVADLIRQCFECQVYTFGSVPLKTYLPDGDIDLTIVSRDPRLKETWANSVRLTLERAERSQDAKFRVKEVQYINAEVKLIKCHVGNIVVDISFNQLGGLCTLCFLEEVDRVIGKDHFFKRSIILIKAWCYYESTILGAHHGLISTYALETLVLYIFHVFHPSLQGPFEVLLRFLEFFGKFDWQKYAVSVWGPVPLMSLPDMIAEPPRKDGGELLLTKAFLDACLKEYAVLVTSPDSQARTFTAKHLNVVDPLRAGNNLGRSVNQTNFLRIAKVLGHSADKLLKILLDSNKAVEECFGDKETGFFKRTNDRLQGFEEKRPDVSEGIVETPPLLFSVLKHKKQQGSQGIKSITENGGNGRPSGSETYFVDHNFHKTSVGQNLGLDLRNQGSSSQLQQFQRNKIIHLAASNGEPDAGFCEGSSHQSMLDVGIPSACGSNAAASASSNLPLHSRRRGHFLNTEIVEPNKKSSMDSSGNVDSVSNVSRFVVNGGESVSITTQRSGQMDPDSVLGEQTSQMSVISRSNSTQTDFDNNETLQGTGEQNASELPPETPSLATEVLPKKVISVRKGSLSHSLGKEGSYRSSCAGEYPTYVEPNGCLDGQGYGLHKGQDSDSRSSVSIPVSVVHPAQIPLTSPHPGQLPMHVPKSMPSVSSSKGHVSVTLPATPSPAGLPSVHPSFKIESSLGLGPRAGPFYATQRGPPPPPGYFQGSPLAHHMGEISNGGGNRLISLYPGQQGDDKVFDQQIWQQIDQKQVRDHQHKFAYGQPVSTMSTAVSSSPQHLTSENSFALSSAPTLVTSAPSHIPTSLQGLRTQVSHGAIKSKLPNSGSSVNVESVAPISISGHGLLEDGQVDETGKPLLEDREMGNLSTSRGKLSDTGSDSGGRGSKAPKSIKEKKVSIKSKSTSSEDTVELGISEDGIPSSSTEGSSHCPARVISDDTGVMLQAYPQLATAPGPALVPAVYPQIISSLSPHGNGIMVSELSPYPPLVSTPRVSQASNQSAALSVGIPSGVSQRPVSAEVGNGTNGLNTAQRQRHMDRVSLPPNVYYPAANHYQYLSMYSPYPMYMMPQGPDPTYIQLDFGGMSYINSYDSYNDATGAQTEDLRRNNQQTHLGVGERLRAAGVATSAIFKPEATADTRASDSVDTSNSTDLLTSDFSGHLNNLQYALWCQNLRGQTVVHGHAPYLNTSTKNLQDYRPWEGPGRPLPPMMAMLPNVMGHGHGPVHGHQPSNVSSARMVGGNFSRNFPGPSSYGSDEPTKSYGGTGTYLPTPRPPYIRERQTSGNSRNQIGYNQDRGERVDRDGNQVHGARFRGNGRGQNKYEHRSQSANVGAERTNAEGKSGERGKDHDFHRHHDSFRRNQVQASCASSYSSPNLVVAPVSALPPVSVAIPLQMCPVIPVMNVNSTVSGTVGTASSPIMVFPLEKKADLGREALEFGSLGPVQVMTSQGGSETDSGLFTPAQGHEQIIVHNPPGFSALSLASSDRSSQGPPSPKHRVMQRAYQLKEEDFPPLPFFAGSMQAVRQV